MEKNFSDKAWKKNLPLPVCEDFPEYEDFYLCAWELAHAHIRSIDKMPQNPYMDEAFCDTQIWIWDTCFMSLFCKFSKNCFPGVESLNNFYRVLYDGESLPRIIPKDNEPKWTRAVPGVENDIFVHIADNPPLFSWAEYENALMSGDREHLKELLYEKKYLQKHYEWFEGQREAEPIPKVFCKSYIINEDIGYRWEGGASGMDNTPRGRKETGVEEERPNNPNMLWLDAICQQALNASCIASLFEIAGDFPAAQIWQKKYLEKKEIVNKYYWNDEDSFYYDIDVNTHEHYRVKTIASFWPLIAGIATEKRAKALLEAVLDPKCFGGEVPLISLARNDGDYHSDGRYWRGGLWLPTAYMALRGLGGYGYLKEAQLAATKILKHMQKTYKEYEPHTIWECYSPEGCTPASSASGRGGVRPDFCGWSALGPISIYIEYVLGFHKIDAFENTVEWAKPDSFKGELGIKNLSFGRVVTDITAKKDKCHVSSNLPYTLIINEKSYEIHEGINEITL